jgi:hypothetical protein
VRDRRVSRFAAALGTVVVAVVMVAGCTSGTGGQATPVASPPSTGDSNLTNSSGSIHLPSPPKDISLAGVDPCALITPAQQPQLGLRAGFRIANDQKYNAPQCNFQYIGNGPVTTSYFNINTVPSAGIRTWLDPYLADSITEQDINGYPGLRIYPKAGNSSSALQCSAVIGVAHGQMLMVMFAFVPLGTPQQQACAKTKQVAQAAMTTLQSMK